MKQFLLVNTSRSRHNRTQRAKNPVHKGLTQKLTNGMRIMRGRPATITEDALMRILPDVKMRIAQGILEVRSMDGRRVHINEDDTFSVDAPKPSPPLPFEKGDDRALREDIGSSLMEHADAPSAGVEGDLKFPEPPVVTKRFNEEPVAEEPEKEEDELELPDAIGVEEEPAAEEPAPEPAPVVEAQEDEESDEEEAPAEEESETPKKRTSRRKARKGRRG